MQDHYTVPELLSLSVVLIGWTIAYVVIIRRSLIDRACGMPLIPLCTNVSWEFIFGFVHPDKPPANLVYIAWFVFDLGILYAYLRHGREEWPRMLPVRWILPASAGILALCFAGVLAVTYQFNDWTGSFTGWGGNVLIYAMFIAMLLRRGGTRGQSMWIILPSLVGTIGLIPFEMRISPQSTLLNFFYVAIVLTGSLYALLLYRAFRAEGKNPWSVY